MMMMMMKTDTFVIERHLFEIGADVGQRTTQ